MIINSKEIYDSLELRNLIEEGIDPLVYVDSEGDVNLLADSIVVPDEYLDPYWTSMAKTLLKSLIYYTKATQERSNQTLIYCKELLLLAKDHDSNNKLTEKIDKLPFDHPAKTIYASIKIAPEKTYKSIIDTLNNIL